MSRSWAVRRPGSGSRSSRTIADHLMSDGKPRSRSATSARRPGAVPFLIQALVDPGTSDEKVVNTSERLRGEVIEALGRIGPDAAEAIPKLIPQANVAEQSDRALVLGRIGKPAIPAMIITLHDKDPALRTFAVRGIGGDARRGCGGCTGLDRRSQ